MFKSIEDVKRVGEKFKKGTIVPQRVLYIKGKGKKNARHHFKFKVDMYRVLTHDNGHLFLIDLTGEKVEPYCIISLSGNHRNVELCGDEYGKSYSHFVSINSANDYLNHINKMVFGVEND